MLETLLEPPNKEPFHPFKIVTAGGEKYEVEDPNGVAVGKTQINHFYPRSDRWVLIRLNQITAFESPQHAA